MMWNYYNGGWGLGIFGWFFMIVMMVLPVLFVVWVIYELTGSHRGKEKSAIEILDERYAKGEISKEEYESKKKEISK